ncbi:MAG: DUF503 domain-containing protein [Armatimonadota bacterium]
MVVGVLVVSLVISESNSLKDKRHVIKSLLDVIRNRFNVSAAELGELDTWRRSELGFACVSNDRKVANSMLNKVLQAVESDPRISVANVEMEFI